VIIQGQLRSGVQIIAAIDQAEVGKIARLQALLDDPSLLPRIMGSE
jgi:hypothetical protein